MGIKGGPLRLWGPTWAARDGGVDRQGRRGRRGWGLRNYSGSGVEG